MNPHLKAWRRSRAHRRRVEGPRLGALLPLIAALAAGWMARTALLGFLVDPRLVPEGVAGLAARLGLICCGAMSLYSYSALVRGEDRPVLDPHPVDPGQLLPYLAIKVAAERWSLPIGVALLALPLVWFGQPLAWLLILAVCYGGWFVGLLVGFPIYLGAIWAAESPSLALFFELLRGDNPRLQAALIYAPGAVLMLGGVGVWQGAAGAGQVLAGEPLAGLKLLLPFVLGIVAWLPAASLGRAYHFRATTLLAEIDAMYAGTEDPEEARRVYLDWAVKFLPAGLRSEVTKELRHGWRGLRSWITGAWGAGVVAALAGWSADPAAPSRAGLVAGAGLVLVGAVAVRLAATDPLWLEQALPVPPGRRLAARALAVFGWLQGAILLPTVAVAIRQGGPAAGGLLASLEVEALVIALIGAGMSRLRARGMFPYVALAALVWAGAAGLGAVAL